MSSEKQQSLTAIVWQHCPSKYTSTRLLVLLRLAGLSEREGHAWPGVKTLAAMVGVKTRQLRYVIKSLSLDGVLRVQRRTGHSSHFFIQVDEIRKLPSVVPVKEEVPVTPEPAAPAPAVEDGRSIAASLVMALRKENPSAIVPLELDEWAAKFQTLLDAGHDAKTVKQVCRFGRKHAFWEIDIQSTDVATTVVNNFPQMLAAYKKSVEREKEKAA
jgi:hypothetical protein